MRSPDGILYPPWTQLNSSKMVMVEGSEPTKLITSILAEAATAERHIKRTNAVFIFVAVFMPDLT
jgi:hypothetical protein